MYRLSIKTHSLSKAIVAKAAATAKKSLTRAMEKAARNAVAVIREEAKQADTKAYAKALTEPGVVETTENGFSINLDRSSVKDLEVGFKPYDMKPKLLKYGKQSKNGGRYVDIPFTHAASTVPSGIKRALQSVPRVSMTTPGKVFRRLGKTVRHTQGIHDDMMKSGGKYTTIRRLSTNSDPQLWWHPGFKGYNLLKKLEKRIKADTIAILKAGIK